MLQVTFTNNEDGVLIPEITIDAAAVNAMMRLAKKQESLTLKYDPTNTKALFAAAYAARTVRLYSDDLLRCKDCGQPADSISNDDTCLCNNCRQERRDEDIGDQYWYEHDIYQRLNKGKVIR